jgi:hypothetical protein
MSSPSPSRPRRTRIRAGAVVVALAVLSVTAPLAAAAGGTTMSLVSTDDSIGVGETTTIDVVVDDVDGGAGAAEFRVSLADTTVARLTDVTVLGSGRVEQAAADDGSWIDVKYAFVDTADTGSVTVAEVTVEGVAPGTTGVAIESAAGNSATVVYDESGVGYTVTGTNGIRLAVGDAGSTADAGSDRTVPEDGSDGSDAAGTGSSDGVSSAEPGDTAGEDASSDANEASPGSGDAASNEVTEPTPEESDDAGASTRFGVTPDPALLDRVAGALGGPVGALAAAVVVVLLGVGLRRRW